MHFSGGRHASPWILVPWAVFFDNNFIPMRGLLSTLLSPILIFYLIADEPTFEPTLVVLYPHEVAMSDEIAKEVTIYTQETEITDEVRESFIKEGLAENWKIIREKELEIIKKQDYAGLLALLLSREVTYQEVQFHDNPLIFVTRESSGGDKAKYKMLAEKYQVSWVLNILKVHLYTHGERKHLEITIQLYNTSAGWLFLDKTFEVHDSEIAQCDEGTWFCLASQVKNQIAHEVADKIERNRHRHSAK